MQLTLHKGVATIQIDDHSPIQIDLPLKDYPIVGISYRFQGTGSVQYTSISNTNGKVFFEDRFN
jgi:hypothetical protein